MKFNPVPVVASRLMRLSIYLDSLPKDYKEFEMGSYFEGKDDDVNGKLEKKYALHNGGVHKCGTSACALGHGPSAGILVPREFVTKDDDKWDVDWDSYSHLFTDSSDELFEWMFSGDWAYVDNHHYGAAARIKYVLMGLDVPDLTTDYPTRDHVDLYLKFRKRKTVGIAAQFGLAEI